MPSVDEQFMHAALEQAERGLYTTTPNPRVGCVFVRDGQIIASGYHKVAGGPHAEVDAIHNAAAAGVSLQGSTAYVTLEPCSHQGRTGSCAQALIPTGVKRVVAAITDPNPLVAGKGMAILQAAGIETQVGVLEDEARWLNRGFLSRMERKRPWVRLKVASSADGTTALPNGVSQWITGPEARQDGHKLRAQACAVLTGIGTVKADNPQLNVRGVETTRQPIKVVVDSQLEISPDAILLQTGQIIIAHCLANTPGLASPHLAVPPTWHLTHPNRDNIQFMDAAPPVEHSAEQTKAQSNNYTKRKTDLHLLLTKLAEQGIQELHLEAGFGLNGSFMEAGWVDEVVQYIAPRFLGEGLGLFRMTGTAKDKENLPQTLDWKVQQVNTVGTDIKITWIKSAL
ncbi:MAG: bifunctional diaminohydroxyphosphoribosylaminopyrimidine deaminase/5-amino-6-(5-phosphoribosylamino)uracil reductase RibD [Limnobacter sp.]|nr:bifunctional diaminohydroxyphosphoribosylaminopyrimidine deaminase/5-amino-6-(5-phosphoribosylamino)uracil reductase RibD [Limnobacter sp.]